MQKGDIVPPIDEPARLEHIREMNFREALDYSLTFD